MKKSEQFKIEIAKWIAFQVDEFGPEIFMGQFDAKPDTETASTHLGDWLWENDIQEGQHDECIEKAAQIASKKLSKLQGNIAEAKKEALYG